MLDNTLAYWLDGYFHAFKFFLTLFSHSNINFISFASVFAPLPHRFLCAYVRTPIQPTRDRCRIQKASNQ